MVRRRRQLTRKQLERQREVQILFKGEVMRLDQYRCIGASAFGSNHDCEGAIQAHHAIRQQTLRAHISTLELTENEIQDWLWNSSVGVTLCATLHDAHTSRKEPVPFEWLPGRVVDFATDRQILHLLLREHPRFLREDGV